MVKALINNESLQHNLDVVRRYAPQSKIIAMIKANAYGHGLIPCARVLADADCLGLARLSEVQQLRSAGIDTPLLLFSGVNDANELVELNHLDCAVVIHSRFQVELLLKTKLTKPMHVFLKINTGMNRLGLSPDVFVKFYKILQASDKVASLAAMTHFSDADQPAKPKTAKQLACFQEAVAGLSLPLSAAASSAIMSFPAAHLDWVRPGIMLYGSSPFADKSASDLGLAAVMTLTAPVIATYELAAGSEVGYGSTYRCAATTQVAVIAIGYGDGYPRHAKTGTPVLLRGQRCKLIGRVSMDSITVEFPEGLSVAVGDEAELWGEQLSVDEVAAHAETISYELLTHIAPRLTRFFSKI